MSRGELAEQCTMHRKFYGESPCKNRIEPGEKSALSTEKSENSLFRPAPSPIFPFCRAFIFQRSGYFVLTFPFLDVTKNSTLLNRTECLLVSHRSKLSNGNEENMDNSPMLVGRIVRFLNQKSGIELVRIERKRSIAG